MRVVPPSSYHPDAASQNLRPEGATQDHPEGATQAPPRSYSCFSVLPELSGHYALPPPRRGLLADGSPSSVEDHYAVILDALAALCIPAPQSFVVALALELDSKGKKITLSVAHNRSTKSKSREKFNPVPHLTDIWECLQSISEIYDAQRRRKRGPERHLAVYNNTHAVYNQTRDQGHENDHKMYMDWAEKSPPMTEKDIGRNSPEAEVAIRGFVAKLYSYSWTKFRYRFDKNEGERWAWLIRLGEKFDHLPAVNSFFAWLESIHELFIINTPDDSTKRDLFDTMHALRTQFVGAKTAFKDQATDEEVQTFERYVNKILYIHTNAEILVRFAFSERFHQYLDRRVQLGINKVFIKAACPTLKMPKDVDDWKLIVNQVLKASPCPMSSKPTIRSLH